MKLKDYNLVNGKIRRQKKIDDIIVILFSNDGLSPKEGRKNLLAIDKEDNILWIAELPSEFYDSYYDMKYVDGIIHAESSNSFLSEINPKTGEIIKCYMVK